MSLLGGNRGSERAKTFPKEQRRVFRAPDLREILVVFNGEECCPSGVGVASLMEEKCG